MNILKLAHAPHLCVQRRSGTRCGRSQLMRADNGVQLVAAKIARTTWVASLQREADP